ELNELNFLPQADEVEALSCIYGEEWTAVDVASRNYCIHVADSSENPKREANLLVLIRITMFRLPGCFKIYAGNLRQDWTADFYKINERKRNVFCSENPGEDLVYLLAEGVREFLQNFTEEGKIQGCMSSISVESFYVEEEFDPSLLGEFTKLSFKEDLLKSSSVECPNIIHGETLTDRKSTFQPHLAVVVDKTQVSAVMSKLYENKKIANATHNMLAYRIVPSQGGPVYQGCDDDGETHAGSRMLHLLQVMNADNVLVVVSRWYGGIHLGPDRFKHINNCTRQILEDNGFNRDKDKKTGAKKGKKAR
ncbi:hypothetical protein EGW08_002380, partial [Elysia chlorotica]